MSCIRYSIMINIYLEHLLKDKKYGKIMQFLVSRKIWCAWGTLNFASLFFHSILRGCDFWDWWAISTNGHGKPSRGKTYHTFSIYRKFNMSVYTFRTLIENSDMVICSFMIKIHRKIFLQVLFLKYIFFFKSNEHCRHAVSLSTQMLSYNYEP